MHPHPWRSTSSGDHLRWMKAPASAAWTLIPRCIFLISPEEPRCSCIPVPTASAMMVAKSPTSPRKHASVPGAGHHPTALPSGSSQGAGRAGWGDGVTPSLHKVPAPSPAVVSTNGSAQPSPLGPAGQAQTPLSVSATPADEARCPTWTCMLPQTRSPPQPFPPIIKTIPGSFE